VPAYRPPLSLRGSKAAWGRTVAAADSSELPRQVKATLLALLRYVRSDGSLNYSRSQLCRAAGDLPDRTMGRHLAQAVDLGWLEHVTSGHNGKHAVYRISTPQARQEWLATDAS
jgi:hypothetical protein